MRYKVGDYVTIRQDLEVEKYYGGKQWFSDKQKFAGKRMKICAVYSNDNSYHLENGDGWCFTDCFTDEMFENEIKSKYKVGDYVTVRKDLIPGEVYGKLTFSSSMVGFRGQAGKICMVTESGNYMLENGEVWIFTGEMLIGGCSSYPDEIVSSDDIVRIGDKVKRTADNFDNVVKDRIYTIKNIVGSDYELCECRGKYHVGYFIKVNEIFTKNDDTIRVGDKVKRIGENCMEVKEGEIYTIKNINGESCSLVECGHTYQLENFKKVISIKEFNNIKEETKMELKIETEMEKKALAQAKEQEIKRRIDAKADDYRSRMQSFISYETEARRYRQMADDYKKQLGITEKEMKDIF